MKKLNKKIVPKAFLGTAIMGGLGIVNSMVNANSANKAARKAKQLAYESTTREADVMQQNYLTQYNEALQDDLPVYAKGGKVPDTTVSSTTGKFDTVGGDLNPISSTAEVVQGNTHNEKKIDNSYGVTLLDDGNPVVNVEDEEVIVDNNLVFSDKLKKGNKTFADIAYDINSKIGDLEVQAKTLTKPAEKFSNERTIQGLKKENEELFKEQELVKANTATNDEDVVEVVDNKVPVAKWGKKIYDNEDDVFSAKSERVPTTAEDLAPMLIDNVANLITTNSVPSVQRPRQRVAPMINTRVNVNPALADVNSTIGSNNAIIRGNTSNSAVARSAMTANNIKGVEARGNMLAQKEAQERMLQNEQNKLYSDNANTNADLMDEYSLDVRDATLQKNSANSKNLVNAIEDYKAVQQKEFNQQQEDDVIMLDLMDDQTGDKKRVYDRLGRPLYSKAKNVLAREKRRLNRN